MVHMLQALNIITWYISEVCADNLCAVRSCPQPAAFCPLLPAARIICTYLSAPTPAPALYEQILSAPADTRSDLVRTHTRTRRAHRGCFKWLTITKNKLGFVYTIYYFYSFFTIIIHIDLHHQQQLSFKCYILFTHQLSFIINIFPHTSSNSSILNPPIVLLSNKALT